MAGKATRTLERVNLPTDRLDKADVDPPEQNQHRGAKVMVGLGMLAGGLGLGATTAAAQTSQVEVQMQAQATPLVHQDMLSHFQKDGAVYKRTLGFRKDLTPQEALQRLEEKSSVYVELKGGATEKIKSTVDLETLDTLDGKGLQPNLPSDLVQSLRELERGTAPRDGLFKPDGKEITAFDAYRILNSPRDGAGTAAALYGALGVAIGLAVAGGGMALMSHGLLPQVKSRGDNFAVAAGIGVVSIAAIIGAGAGYNAYQADWPKTLEIRNGADSGLTLRQLSDVVEQSNWLRSQASHPFTPEQQAQSLQHLSSHGGVYSNGMTHKKLQPGDALKKLQAGKSIALPDPVEPGKFIEIPSLRHLQEYDSVHGLAVNPVTSEAETASLRFLAKNGQFLRKGKQISGYEALDFMLRERQPQEARLNGKTYTLANLTEVQELNALKGDGNNTILPDLEFRALRHFDSQMKKGDKAVDAFEAVQSMRKGQAVGIQSYGRQAQISTPTDAHQLYSLEITGKNTILPQGQYDLLQYWQQNGGYGNGRAYEALQSLERGGEFEVHSAGRLAPARSYQDLTDLAAFEGPNNPFPDTVPKGRRDRLEYFQSTHPKAFRVGNREGRAYEGYRQLRDGHAFEVRAGGVFNLVEGDQDLHELDALLGRRVNDILPKDQYDLLHHLGDNSRPEGMVVNGAWANSYQTLQAFQKGQNVSYQFVGGDFAETLSIPTQKLESMAETKQKRDNQKEYDRYRYTVPEFQEKMKRQENQLPDLARNDLAQGQSHLRQGEQDESRGRSHLSDAQSDLSRGRSDKSWAEGRLMMAYAMPSENAVTKYRTVTDSDGSTRQESYTDYEHNWARDAAISAAQSDIWRAESKIRQAQSDISDAEREIRQAQDDIRKARGEISESEEIIRIVGRFSGQLNSINESNYAEIVGQLKSQVARMRQLSHTASLNANLAREGKLIENMNRPHRPDGWKMPSPLVQY